MKHTAQQGLSAESLRASVPLRYRPLLPATLSDTRYTLLLFRTDRNDVVLSRTVESAMADVADVAEPVIAVGGCFTTEGLELLRERGAMILQLSEYYWTDESYRAIRESH